MRLFKIKIWFRGRDLDEEAVLGLVVAESKDAVYDFINATYHYSEWPKDVEMTREAIIAQHGDFKSACVIPSGRTYDKKYSWEDLDEIPTADVKVLLWHSLLMRKPF